MTLSAAPPTYAQATAPSAPPSRQEARGERSWGRTALKVVLVAAAAFIVIALFASCAFGDAVLLSIITILCAALLYNLADGGTVLINLFKACFSRTFSAPRERARSQPLPRYAPTPATAPPFDDAGRAEGGHRLHAAVGGGTTSAPPLSASKAPPPRAPAPATAPPFEGAGSAEGGHRLHAAVGGGTTSASSLSASKAPPRRAPAPATAPPFDDAGRAEGGLRLHAAVGGGTTSAPPLSASKAPPPRAPAAATAPPFDGAEGAEGGLRLHAAVGGGTTSAPPLSGPPPQRRRSPPQNATVSSPRAQSSTRRSVHPDGRPKFGPPSPREDSGKPPIPPGKNTALGGGSTAKKPLT